MISSISDFSGSKIDLDKWSQNVFDNTYYLWRNAYARLDDVNFVGKEVEFNQKAITEGLDRLKDSHFSKEVIDKLAKKISTQKISYEKYDRDMIKMSEIYFNKMGTIIQQRIFTLPEKDRLLADAYEICDPETGFPHVRCSGYVLYHLNMRANQILTDLKKTIVKKPGIVIFYADLKGGEPKEVVPRHIGLLLRPQGKEWIVLSKWGEGPVVSHPEDRTLSDYSSAECTLIQELRYGIPLFRLIADRAEEVLRVESETGPFHAMVPSPLTPLGVAKRWERWIQETDHTMPLFSKAAMGERTRKICAKYFFEKWSPIVLHLTKNSWVCSRTAVSEGVRRVIVDLDPELYQKFFSSFWAEHLKQ